MRHTKQAPFTDRSAARTSVRASDGLANVRYEIRGKLARRALELERLAASLTIETPLMWLDKAATWALAEELGGAALVDLILEDTHTCYLGERGTRHAWGYGCAHCPACVLRARGYERWSEARGAREAKTGS